MNIANGESSLTNDPPTEPLPLGGDRAPDLAARAPRRQPGPPNLAEGDSEQSEQQLAQLVLDERRRDLIRVMSRSVLILVGIGLVVVLFVGVTQPQANLLRPAVLLIFALALGLGALTLEMVRRERTLIAANLLVYQFWLATALSILTDPPLPDGRLLLRFTPFFSLTVLWAGLLIGPRSSFVVATLASSLVSIALALHSPELSRGDVVGYLAAVSDQASIAFTVYYVLGFVVWFFSIGLQRQLSARAIHLAAANRVIRAEVTRRAAASTRVSALAAQMATAAAQQSTASSLQTGAVATVRATMEELGQAGEAIAARADSATAFAANAQRETAWGRQVIDQALGALQQIDGHVADITRRMSLLDERGAATESVTAEIAMIADELHLLALNAKLEAVGAGAAGARFGVVADEVSRLALAAQASAEQTRQLLSEARAATQEAMRATVAGSQIAGESAHLGHQAATASALIAHLVEQASAQMQAIDSSAGQQRVAIAHIVQTMRELTTMSVQTERASQETAQVATALRIVARQLLISGAADLVAPASADPPS